MKKKALSLALALVMCLGLTVPAFAAESDFTIEDGVLTSYTGAGGDVVIPDGVASIGGGAFKNCASLTSVIVPSSVTGIGEEAFRDCTSLTNVSIPSRITYIGKGAFQGCTSVSQAEIPYKVTSLEKNLFYGCTSLKSVTIPLMVTRIGSDAFENCKNLTDIYYAGSEEQWKAVTIDEGNDPLKAAAIHYNGGTDTPAEPEQPTTPPAIEVEDIPASGTALASTQTVTVDGKAVEFQMYALADANGDLTNYIKLRDMAYILNGTKAQFAVGYDGIISLTTGQPYQAGGTEMTTPFSGDRAYTGGAQTLKIDGKDVAMTAITLTDDNGGGYNYFKLRDLGKALGFNVSWDNGVIVESDKPYEG